MQSQEDAQEMCDNVLKNIEHMYAEVLATNGDKGRENCVVEFEK